MKGVTLVELLVVVALMAILAASSTPFLSRFIQQNNLKTTTDTIAGNLRKAQENSMDGKNDMIWGVCIIGSTLRLYSGTCALPAISNDFPIPGSVSITGLSNVTFSRRRGEPSAPLTTTVTTNLGSKTITVNAAGGMSTN